MRGAETAKKIYTANGLMPGGRLPLAVRKKVSLVGTVSANVKFARSLTGNRP
jgi:hypothetical protein